MIIDSSAILAILFGEPETQDVELALAKAKPPVRLSGIGYWEIMTRLDRAGMSAAKDEAQSLFDKLGIRIEEIDREQILLATDAQTKFGKGNHKAKLNMGNCFAYALAKSRNEALLYKGNDFAMTDIESAL